MFWSSWFPSLAVNGGLVIAVWLARNLIATRLKSSVEHEFNSKLETLRAQFRESEERFRADLRAKETEIAALQSGALSTLASRQAAIDKRRLEAIDQLWSAVIALEPARKLAQAMSTLNVEFALKSAAKEPTVRKVYEVLGTGFDIKTVDISGAAIARPFVSPMAWATFTAINTVVMHSVVQWHIIKAGLDRDVTGHKAIKDLLKAALPAISDYIEEYNLADYYPFINVLEGQLLGEIQKMTSGIDSDVESVQRAAEIIKQANRVQEEMRAKNEVVKV